MDKQLIFLDTEFTSFHKPELISIGLAASTGEEFYAEVPYRKELCSEFVREVVIPQLADVMPSSSSALSTQILNWFKIVMTSSQAILCFDSHHDKELFCQIFDGYPPGFVRMYQLDDGQINEFLRYDYHKQTKLKEHHALNDANALRYACRHLIID